ncbi:NAD(P)-dependent alcohol dehydrogenase [Corticicoccus populi]|uniref:NAD(P)-dependent alcohol dehydrogenase n=1 Tax=Corticicoccus populi TaxID=1812821 RepID=A0ABW5WWI5_9STAP
MHDISEVSVEDREVPSISAEEVLIEVKAVGVCGSDVHYYNHGRIGRRVVKYPHVQGHECAGVVIDIGEDVKNLKPGDRVVVEPGIACGECDFCKKGKYNLCDEMVFISTPPHQGAFAKYISHKSSFVHKIPDELDFTTASLAEPLAVGIHVMNRAEVKPDDTIVIVGMGPVGLLMVIAARAYGIKNILVFDVEDFRLKIAESLGAARTFNAKDGSVKEQITSTGFESANIFIDTSGNNRVIYDSVNVIKKGGKVVLVGFPSNEETTFDFISLLQKEIDIISIYRYRNVFPSAVKILTEYSNIARAIITHKFDLENIKDAMEQSFTSPNETGKVIIYPHGY